MGTVRSIKSADAAQADDPRPGLVTNARLSGSQIMAAVLALLLVLGVFGSLAAYW